MKQLKLLGSLIVRGLILFFAYDILFAPFRRIFVHLYLTQNFLQLSDYGFAGVSYAMMTTTFRARLSTQSFAH